MIRAPAIINKHKIEPKLFNKLKVKDKKLICEPIFWRNNVISAWCISKAYKDNSFWIGVYDDDAPHYKSKIRITFNSYEGMCDYNFTKFYDYKQIETISDLVIQEEFIKTINYLLDNNIFELL